MLRDKLLILRYSRLARIPPAQYFAEILHEQGLPVLVFEFGEGHEGGLLEYKTPPRLRFPCRFRRIFPGSLKSLILVCEAFFYLAIEIARTGRPRLLVANGLMEEAIALGLNLLFGIPFAVQVHEIYDEKDLTGFNRVLFRLTPLVMNRAVLTIFPEATRADIYTKRYGMKRAPYIVFNCPRKTPKVSPGALRQSWNFKPRTSIILYMGGLADKNAVLEVIEAMEFLPDSGLVLAGWSDSKYDRAMRDRAASIGVAGRIRWVGAVKERWAYLAACDLSVCLYRPDELRTKHQATASNKLFEAGTQGVPVLVSGETDFTDFLSRYPIGVAAKDFSGRAIADAALKIFENRDYADGISRRARQLHEEKFNFEAQAEQVVRVVKEYFPEVLANPASEKRVVQA